MSLAIASKSTANGTSGDVTVTKPTGLAVGDMMIAFIHSNSNGTNEQTHSGPSGWTQLESVTPNNSSVLTAWAIKATSTETAASDFSWTSGGDNDNTIGTIFRITSTEGFATVSDTIASQSDSDLSNTGVTTLSSINILFLCGAEEKTDGDVNFSAYSVTNDDPTWTEEYDINYEPSGIAANLGVASADYNLQQATGIYSITSDIGGQASSVLVAVGEPQDGNGTPALVSSTQTAFPPTAVEAGTTGTPAFVASTQTAIPPTNARATSPTQWTNEAEESTTWTNEEI